MQKGAILICILRTPSPSELLRLCEQALLLVSFIVFLFIFFCTLTLSLQLKIIRDDRCIVADLALLEFEGSSIIVGAF